MGLTVSFGKSTLGLRGLNERAAKSWETSKREAIASSPTTVLAIKTILWG
jgi:hypothetical protein